MRKFLSLMLAVLLVGSMFIMTSCENPVGLLEKADKALKEAPYTVTMSMDFECDDDNLNKIFDLLTMEVPVTVDGENLSMSLEMEILGQTIGSKMILVDKVLYTEADAGIMQLKTKSTLDDTQLKEFLADNNAEMPISHVQFKEFKMEKKDGKTVIACTGISTDGIAALDSLLADTLKAAGAEAAAGDLSFVITLKDGKYESMALTCSYSVTAEGETKTVSMTMNAKYAYENVETITAPADADSYTEVAYGADLLG